MQRRLLTTGVVLLGLVVSSLRADLAEAFEHSLTLAIDTDNLATSGCAWSAGKVSGGPVATGIERLLVVGVDASSVPLQVSSVDLQACEGSTFGAATSLASGGWPVGAGTGVSGADVVEFSVPIPLLGAGPTLRFYAGTRSAAGGHDLLLTSDGTPSGAAILFGVGAALPALDGVGGLLIALVLLALGFLLLHRRWARTAVFVACVLVALRSASALVLALDGQVGEWASSSPLAEDVAGDTAGGGGVHSDLVALFAALEADTLALRIDVSGIPRPLDYTEFTHVTDATALEAAIAAGTNTWLYLDHEPRDYFIDNPVAIALDGKHWAIHGGSIASTFIRPLNPDDDLFVISGSGSISFTGMRLGTYPSTSIDKKCLHFLDDGVKRIEANHVSQVGCSVLIESPGEAVFQAHQIRPRSDLGVVRVNVHDAFIVDHPLADVSFLSVETTTNNYGLATEIDCGLDGSDCARFRQKQGRLRVLNGSLQAHYGRAFFRFDSTSALGPHVIAASRSEGANGYQSAPYNRAHTIAYVPAGATVDLALLAVSESADQGASGCRMVDWNGSGGRLWLAGVINDCAGAALVSGTASGGRIQAILNANDDQGDGYLSVTGAQVFTAHNIVGQVGSRGWLDVDARMADWAEAWDLPALDWPASLKRPVVSAPLPGMVNVATYGATPDDDGDDAQAFQDALDDHCDPGGKPIMLYCPDGKYDIETRSLAYGHTQFGSACESRPPGGWFAGRACRLVRESSAKDAVFRYGSHSAFFQGWHFETRPFDETEVDPINEPAFSSEHLGAYAPQKVVFQDVVFDGGVAGACMGCVIDGNNSEFIAVRSTFRNAGCGWCSGKPNALNNMPMDSLFEDNLVHMGELPLYDEQLGAMLSNGGGKVNGSLRVTLKRSRAYDLSGKARYAFYHHGLVSDGARITGNGIGWTSGVSVRLYDQAVFSGLEAGSLLQDAPPGGDIFIDSTLNRFDPTLRDNWMAVLAIRSETPEAYRASIVDEALFVNPVNARFPRVEHVPAYAPPTPHVSLGIRMGQYQAPGQAVTATLSIQGDAVGDVQVWIDCDDGAGEIDRGSHTPDGTGTISIPAGCTPVEAGAYRVQVRVEREGVEDRDVQLLRVEPAGRQSLELTVSPTQGTAGSYLGSEVSATLLNDPAGAFDALYYCRKSCDGGEKNLDLCADNSDCVGSVTSGSCRAQGTCRGGQNDGLPCHFDTDCPRDATTLHHFCEPDDWEFRAVGSTWTTDPSVCDDLYNASPGTYAPQLQVRHPSVQDSMKDILNVRIVDRADAVPIEID